MRNKRQLYWYPKDQNGLQGWTAHWIDIGPTYNGYLVDVFYQIELLRCSDDHQCNLVLRSRYGNTELHSHYTVLKLKPLGPTYGGTYIYNFYTQSQALVFIRQNKLFLEETK